MKVAILYVSKEKLTNTHKAVHQSSQPACFVRMETTDSNYVGEFGLAEALARAKPMNGETFLNTVPI